MYYILTWDVCALSKKCVSETMYNKLIVHSTYIGVVIKMLKNCSID